LRRRHVINPQPAEVGADVDDMPASQSQLQTTPTPELELFPTPAATPIPYRALIMGETGLAQYWEFNEQDGRTTVDAKRGLVGTLQRGVTSGASGVIGSAARFDGKSGSITLPALTGVTDFTIEGWSYLTVDADVNVNGNNTLYGATRKARLLIRPGGGTYAAYAGVNLDGIEYVIQTRTSQSNLNKWVHWAVTRAGPVLSLYRNGALLGQRSDLPQYATADLSGSIGMERGSQTYFFNGSVDNVALYTVALSQSQIAEHYRSGSYTISINQMR